MVLRARHQQEPIDSVVLKASEAKRCRKARRDGRDFRAGDQRFHRVPLPPKACGEVCLEVRFQVVRGTSGRVGEGSVEKRLHPAKRRVVEHMEYRLVTDRKFDWIR